MAITFEAVYEDGVLKPRQKPDLREHQVVLVRVEPRTPLEALEFYSGIVKADLPREQAEAIARASLLDEVGIGD